MIQSQPRSFVPVHSNVFATKQLTKRRQRRLMLWSMSSALLFIASLFFQDAVQNNSLIGLLFSGSWIATILVNSIFIDYLLRPKEANERNYHSSHRTERL